MKPAFELVGISAISFFTVRKFDEKNFQIPIIFILSWSLL
jgi:hypothetical protein